MPSIRAIPTKYAGVSFRSRLEARWAVFFDWLKIEWEYEPQGFYLPSGGRYLPDFWLPSFEGGCYVEVKPRGGDFTKGREFAKAANVRLWLAEGPPAARTYTMVGALITQDGVTYGGGEYDGIPCWANAYDECRMFSMPGVPTDSKGIISEEDFECGDIDGFVRKAVNAAISARFGS